MRVPSSLVRPGRSVKTVRLPVLPRQDWLAIQRMFLVYHHFPFCFFMKGGGLFGHLQRLRAEPLPSFKVVFLHADLD